MVTTAGATVTTSQRHEAGGAVQAVDHSDLLQGHALKKKKKKKEETNTRTEFTMSACWFSAPIFSTRHFGTEPLLDVKLQWPSASLAKLPEATT